jgi:hypothetical protein
VATSPSIFASLNVCQMAARNSGAFRSRAASANEIRRSVDVDVYVPGLIERTFGPRLLAAAAGRRGGRRKSKAKAAAARANGAKGGRPRKRPRA